MFDFGDEFSIEGYRVPWLIWIQLLVLLLLVCLLYSFTLFTSNRLDFTAEASTSASHLVSKETQIEKRIPKRNTTKIRTNYLETTQVGEQVIKGEITRSTSRRLVREGEEVAEREGSSASHKYQCHHPCDFFRQARIAFLKCLGLDDNSSLSEQRKIKEQINRRES
ncbi:hypothetical protein I3760_03G128700 [Carya illinoinensis]|uniref:Uncharacterized protein n=1 Tax=Carya illinoinensis TaxID=32201 RepID=A0A8T1R385_CARIL|nr:uncharacterized protein LOC122303538 [Carya illinoinensis]KAG2716482.1 hypothetical protein I3760_03G128700 [Carya illinoinensis]KAG6660874.1 hypothetical protein CIPAW_03G134700 [Carya illinoinensis]KAG6721829.1 hypothetical protein I3842_03G131200 [Carya illinoinensis]